MKYGLLYEKQFTDRLVQKGMVMTLSRSLDRRNKIDTLVNGIGDQTFVHPIAVQLTLRSDDIDKMRNFVDMTKKRRVRNAVYIYVQCRDNVPAEFAADKVFDRIVADSRAMRSGAYGIDVGPIGCEAFSLTRRIIELERRDYRRNVTPVSFRK